MTRMFGAALVALALAAVPVLCQEAPPPAKAAPKSSASASAAPLNLNTATVAQLDALPGVGKATAERIIEYRQKAGGFKKTEELMNVQGIGEKNFLKLKPLVTVTMPRGDKTTQQ